MVRTVSQIKKELYECLLIPQCLVALIASYSRPEDEEVLRFLCRDRNRKMIVGFPKHITHYTTHYARDFTGVKVLVLELYFFDVFYSRINLFHYCFNPFIHNFVLNSDIPILGRDAFEIILAKLKEEYDAVTK